MLATYSIFDLYCLAYLVATFGVVYCAGDRRELIFV